MNEKKRKKLCILCNSQQPNNFAFKVEQNKINLKKVENRKKD